MSTEAASNHLLYLYPLPTHTHTQHYHCMCVQPPPTHTHTHTDSTTTACVYSLPQHTHTTLPLHVCTVPVVGITKVTSGSLYVASDTSVVGPCVECVQIIKHTAVPLAQPCTTHTCPLPGQVHYVHYPVRPNAHTTTQ